MNALLFVPLGQRMGVLFNALPRLTAYAWDLAGSLSGTLCFGLFSLKLFSPVLGMAGSCSSTWRSPGSAGGSSRPAVRRVLAIVWEQRPQRHLVALLLHHGQPPRKRPKVTVRAAAGPADDAGPADLQRQGEPVRLPLRRGARPGALHPGDARGTVRWLELQYGLPYPSADGRDRVLVVGRGRRLRRGGGAAAGARHVDAVEIDPAIIGISRRFNAGAPYSDPRVSVHIDDARSFLAKATPGYDLVVFGFLDSQALFSTMNNVRLDGYVYTVESIRSAFRLLNDHGMLTLSFYLGKPWLGPKLYQLVAEATGREPTMYLDAGERHQMILCVPKDAASCCREGLPVLQGAATAAAAIDLPTDDWPFLYLVRKTIPSDYLVAIASLLAFSVATVACLRRRSFGRGDLHFGLLGMGFLLLETKSISDSRCSSAPPGSSRWSSSSGVLLMVIGANLVAERAGASRSGCTRRSSPSWRSCSSCPGERPRVRLRRAPALDAARRPAARLLRRDHLLDDLPGVRAPRRPSSAPT
jgi:hypothetical protein